MAMTGRMGYAESPRQGKLLSMLHGSISSRFICAGLLVCGMAATGCAAPLGKTSSPEVYFYPPPATYADGSVISSPVTVSQDQATTLFPAIPEMAGVVVIVNWSDVCPRSPTTCDFSMVDNILSYWGTRGKKVVLAFATVGFPTRALLPEGPRFVSATPDWLLDKARTYSATVPTLGEVKGQRTELARFPEYSDPQFRSEVGRFVKALARFDGNPAIASVRISLGLLAEDNPNPVGALRYQFPGFGHLDWLAYCRAMTSLFQASFHRTQLEFDMDVVGWIAAVGTAEERKAAADLVHELEAARVLLTFDGWDDDSSGLLNAPKPTGPSLDLKVLRDVKSHGGHVGLEAIGPITSQSMQDPAALIRAADIVRPDRVVFFSFLAAIVREARSGPAVQTKTAMAFVQVQPTAAKSIENAKLLAARFLPGPGRLSH